MKQPDISDLLNVYHPDEIERLKKMAGVFALFGNEALGKFLLHIAAEIERLREEVETWRNRYEAERQDHEATMKAWDEERSGL